jgi:excisionase family DNA binding protein
MAVSKRLLRSVAQTAEALEVSVQTIWRWIAAGALPTHKLGGRTYIPLAVVERIQDEGFSLPSKPAEKA